MTIDFGRLRERDLHLSVYYGGNIKPPQLPEQMVAMHGEMFPTERPL